jgi:hypothetical protein
MALSYGEMVAILANVLGRTLTFSAISEEEERARWMSRGETKESIGGTQRIVIVSPERVGEIIPGGVAPAEPSMVGFTVVVADLNDVRELLKKNGVPFREFQGRLAVAASDACGSVVMFES